MAKQTTKSIETRNKLITAASRGFRRYGYDGIGVDGLASYAGVTSGAFYAHLGSKNDAFQFALEQGLDEVIAAIPQFQEQEGSNWVSHFAGYYLGEEHVNNAEYGCAMAALTIDVVRMEDGNTKIFESKFNKIISLVCQGLSGSNDEDKHRRAWGLLSLLVGGLTFLRALNSDDTRASATEAMISCAIKVAGRAKKKTVRNSKLDRIFHTLKKFTSPNMFRRLVMLCEPGIEKMHRL